MWNLKSLSQVKNAISLKDINEERWGSTQGKGDQLEHLSTSLHGFPFSSAGELFHILQGKLTESLESPLSWAVHSQHGHWFLISWPGSSHPSCPCSQLVLHWAREWLCSYTCPLQCINDIFRCILQALSCACSSSRSCGREHRAAPWLALALLTLLKAAVRKGELLNVN